MRTFEVTTPDGSRTFEVTVPENASRETISTYVNAKMAEMTGGVSPPSQTRRGVRQNSPLVDRVSASLGEPVIARPDFGFMERANLGLADTFEERQKKFLDRNQTGEMRQVLPAFAPSQAQQETVYRRGPDQPWRLADEPGVSWGDLADRPQEIPTLIGQGLLAASGPPGWLAQAGLQAAVPGVMHLAKEGVEALRGDQLQSASEVFGQAAIESGADFAAGAVPGGAAALIRGPVRGQASTPPSMVVQDYQNMMQAVDDFGLPEPFAHQTRPDKPLLNILAKQAESTSPVVKKAVSEQKQSFSDLLRGMSTTGSDRAGKTLENAGRAALLARRNQLRQAFDIDPEEAGYAISGTFTDTFNRKSRQEINQAYKEAGRLAEGVSFDLSGAQSVARRVTGPVNATATEQVPSELVDLAGRPLTVNDVTKFVDVSADSGSKVNRVAQLLSVIDPEQQNWEVVKELRTQVGDAIKDLPLQDASSGQAKAIYGALSRVMENPINGNNAFVSAWKRANDLAKFRFEVFDESRVLRLLGEKDAPAAVAKAAATDATSLTPTIRTVIDSYSPEMRDTFRMNMQRAILDNPGGAESLLQKWQADNPGALKWLFRDNERMIDDFVGTARTWDELRKSPIEQFVNNAGAKIDKGRRLVRNTDRTELAETISMLGGPNSDGAEAIRYYIVNDVIESSTITKDGYSLIKGDSLTKAIDEARRRGTWDLLSAAEKRKISGLEAYSRNVFRTAKDAGTSLEAAQIGSAFKHPSTAPRALSDLLANNRILTSIILSPRTSRLVRPTTGGQMNRGRSVPAMTFLGNFAAETLGLIEDEFGRTTE